MSTERDDESDDLIEQAIPLAEAALERASDLALDKFGVIAGLTRLVILHLRTQRAYLVAEAAAHAAEERVREHRTACTVPLSEPCPDWDGLVAEAERLRAVVDGVLATAEAASLGDIRGDTQVPT